MTKCDVGAACAQYQNSFAAEGGLPTTGLDLLFLAMFAVALVSLGLLGLREAK